MPDDDDPSTDPEYLAFIERELPDLIDWACSKYGLSYHDGKDVGMELMGDAFVHWQKVKRHRNQKGWLRRVKMNAQWKLWRAQKRHPSVSLDPDRMDRQTIDFDPAELVDRAQLSERTKRALGATSPREQAAVVLWSMDYTDAEIARYLSQNWPDQPIAANSVKTLRLRGRQKITRRHKGLEKLDELDRR